LKPVLLFDLDGTLIDSEVGITRCIAHALERMGEPVPDAKALRRWVGPSLWSSFGSIFDDEARVEQAIAFYRERFEDEGWREHRIYDGVPAMIEAVAARGYRLAVVTAKNEPHARRIVDVLPFGRHFEAVVGATLDGSRREKPQLIAEALRRLALDAADCVMIGDRHLDIEGAQAHGMASLGVLWGFGGEDELRAAGARKLLNHPADLGLHLVADPGQTV